MTRQRAKAIENSVAGISHAAGDNSLGKVVNGDTEDTSKKGGRAKSKMLRNRERPSREPTDFAFADSSKSLRGITKGKISQGKQPIIPSRRSPRWTKSQSSESDDSKREYNEHSSSEEEESRAEESRVGQSALQDLLASVAVEGGRRSSKAPRKQGEKTARRNDSSE